MDEFKSKQYIEGQKYFWIFAILIIVIRILENFIAGITTWGHYVLEAVFLFLLYRGYVWVWYFNVMRVIFNFIRAIIVVVTVIPELYWMIHVYPPLKLFVEGLEVATIVVIGFILIKKKNLKYFVKMKQLERIGRGKE